MNKLFNIVRSTLLLITVFLTIKYLTIFEIRSIYFIIYFILLMILIITSIIDLVKKRTFDIRYNILYILILLVINFIFIRTIYDNHFIYNSSNYLNLVKEITKDNYSNYLYDLKEQNILFLDQNLIYFILMLLGITIYRKIRLSEFEKSKYSMLSIICLIISVLSTISSIEIMETTTISTIILYLLFTIILIGIEVFLLIKNNHIKKECIIYFSFLFNLFALIFIFVSLKTI